MSEKIYKVRHVTPLGEKEKIDTGFTGDITLEIPKYKARMALVKEHASEKDVDKISTAAYDVCAKYIKTMDLKYDGKNITNLDDLTDYQNGVAIMYDVFNQLLQGYTINPKG